MVQPRTRSVHLEPGSVILIPIRPCLLEPVLGGQSPDFVTPSPAVDQLASAGASRVVACAQVIWVNGKLFHMVVFEGIYDTRHIDAKRATQRGVILAGETFTTYLSRGIWTLAGIQPIAGSTHIPTYLDSSGGLLAGVTVVDPSGRLKRRASRRERRALPEAATFSCMSIQRAAMAAHGEAEPLPAHGDLRVVPGFSVRDVFGMSWEDLQREQR
mgnify:CR=1 FL=1|jgi:hypothetical protein